MDVNLCKSALERRSDLQGKTKALSHDLSEMKKMDELIYQSDVLELTFIFPEAMCLMWLNCWRRSFSRTVLHISREIRLCDYGYIAFRADNRLGSDYAGTWRCGIGNP